MSSSDGSAPHPLTDPRRVRPLNTAPRGNGPVLYWMHREHRVRDNWALLHAREHAAAAGRPLAVVYCLASTFLDATRRHFDFLLGGLRSVSTELDKRNIPFILLRGDAAEEVPGFAARVEAGVVVTDFDSLRPKRQWLDGVAEALQAAGVPLEEVDSRNVVPCLAASDKREYAARTIRTKIHKLLPEFLHDVPELGKNPAAWSGTAPAPDWSAAADSIAADASVEPVDWLQPGEAPALDMLELFITERLGLYAEHSNDPTREAISDLSPYLHFGMLSAQRVAWEVSRRRGKRQESAEAFLEQVVVRRELSDNFCFHAQNYDSVDCFPDWAKETLDDHRRDEREYIYTEDEFEQAQTHDDLWNAAQNQMRFTGKMHNYMRMYWAKKILEWTETPEEALRIIIRQNDRYELDGRDANGYTGAAWSVGGVHDRPWKERPVFGKIRYMNYAGCKRKFDVDGYVAMVGELAPE